MVNYTMVALRLVARFPKVQIIQFWGVVYIENSVMVVSAVSNDHYTPLCSYFYGCFVFNGYF